MTVYSNQNVSHQELNMTEFTIVNKTYQQIIHPNIVIPSGTKLIHLATVKRRNKEYIATLLEGPKDHTVYLMEIQQNPQDFITIKDDQEFEDLLFFLRDAKVLGLYIDGELDLGPDGL